ncbi:MAG: PspC domain-containing protein [Methanolobus sp.]|nr:PspC domain-containing protein [Methanolobus sp.]
MKEKEKLKRSRDDRIVAGVAGGVGKYFDTDPTFIRLLFVITVFITEGLMIWVYILMAIIVPEEEKKKKMLKAGEEEKEAVTINDPDLENDSFTQEEDEPGIEQEEEAPENNEKKKEDNGSGIWLGIGLVVLGLLLVIDRLDIFWWLTWSIMWPFLLVLLGIWIILRRSG